MFVTAAATKPLGPAFSGVAIQHDYSDKMTPHTRFAVGAPRQDQAFLFGFDVDVFAKASFDAPSSPYVAPVVLHFVGADAEQYKRYQKHLKRLKRSRFWASFNPFGGASRKYLDNAILGQRIRLGRLVSQKGATVFESNSDEAKALNAMTRAYTRRLNEVWDSKKRRKVHKFKPLPTRTHQPYGWRA